MHKIEPIYPLFKQRIILNASSIRLFYSFKKCVMPFILKPCLKSWE